MGGFYGAASVVLSKALVSAFFLADIKEFISATIQMMNVYKYPSFNAFVPYLAKNMDLIRHELPPAVPLPSVLLTDSQVKFRFSFPEMISQCFIFHSSSHLK